MLDVLDVCAIAITIATVYKYIRNTTKTRSIPELMYFNTQCGSCDEENANLFNEFFYSIFTLSSTDPNNIDTCLMCFMLAVMGFLITKIIIHVQGLNKTMGWNRSLLCS